MGLRQILPWQTNKIFSFIDFLSKVVRIAVFCGVTARRAALEQALDFYSFSRNLAKLGKMWRSNVVEIVVKGGVVTTES